jgi:HD-like signal output (HDOD) protein
MPLPSVPPLGEAALLRRLEQVQSLPALPMVVNAVSRHMGQSRARGAEIARLLAHDQALTARILKLANSAFYAPKEAVRTPEQAVVMLGFATVRGIILKASIFTAFEVAEARAFWLHALGTACAARAIANASGIIPADDAFVMGLLHDVGKLALDKFVPDLYKPVRAYVAEHGGLLRDAEEKILGCDHAVVGRFLCQHWSLPAIYRDAIAGHHDLFRVAPQHHPAAALVQLADIMARALLIGNGGDNSMPILDHRSLGLLRIKHDDMADLFRACETELGRAEVFFTIING